MQIFPSFILGARITFSYAIIVTVVSEMVQSPRNGFGIGVVVENAGLAFNTPLFYTCIILVGLFGYLFNLILKYIENKLK